MLKLLRRARGRLFRNELLAEGTNVAIAALAAAILMLIAGAAALDWRLAAAAPAVAVAVGAFRAFRKLPGLYRAAQILDARLGLSDTLSTAFHITHTGADRDGFRRVQVDRAERIAVTVDLRRAMPYRMPHGAYAAFALFLVASSLVALRFAATHSLEMKQPLARALGLDAGSDPATLEAKNKDRDEQRESQSDEKSAEADPSRQAVRPAASEQPTLPAEQSSEPVRNESERGAQSKTERSQREQEESDDQQRNARGQGERSGESGSERQESRQQQASQQQNGSSESSLMSRVKDAVRDLMAKLSPGQQQGQQQNPQQAQNSGNGQNSQPKKGPPQNAPPNQANGQGAGEKGQQERTAQNSSPSGAKSGGKPEGDQQSQPGNGIGNQDGAKELKEAEQLAAMGKISEILGKRAAEITGEATVEVDSGVQQLTTPYGQRGAKASAGGTEIGRDEVPIAFQPYVQQYFEQVRRTPKK